MKYFKPLEKPLNGIDFWIIGFLIHLNFAKSLIWASQKSSNERTNYIICCSITSRFENQQNLKLLSFILGPFKLMIGFCK